MWLLTWGRLLAAAPRNAGVVTSVSAISTTTKLKLLFRISYLKPPQMKPAMLPNIRPSLMCDPIGFDTAASVFKLDKTHRHN